MREEIDVIERYQLGAVSGGAALLRGPRAEGTVTPIGRSFPNAFRANGPDGAFSYFRVIDGKVVPGLF